MKRPSKYGAKRTVVDGIAFDSAREARRWGELRLLEKAGEIKELRRQVPIVLEGRDGALLTPTGRAMRYITDFSYVDCRTGLTVWEDAKGFPTPEYKIKRAVLAAMGIKVMEV